MRPRLFGSAPLSNLESISEQQRFQLLINSITDYAIYMIVDLGGDHQFVWPGSLNELLYLRARGGNTSDGRTGKNTLKHRARL